jgi:hypothetical protein
MSQPAIYPDTPPSNRATPERPSSAFRNGAADSSIANFSIVIGGPIYDFLLRIGLLRFNLPNIIRRIAVLVALTWLPLLVLSFKDGLAFGHRVRIPFLYDFSMYGRFVLGLPLLLLAEAVIDPAIRRAVSEFVKSGIVDRPEVPALDDVLRRTQRLRDSAIPELTLLVLAFFPVFIFQHEWSTGTVSSWHTTASGLTTAGWWYAVFSTPILRFITYRWAFRYFVWSVLLFRIGRLDLILMPTHPDHCGGLGFLSITQRRFGVIFCALGCAFGGRVANSIMFEGATFASFKVLIIGYLVLSVIVGLLPLTMVAPKLMKVRRAGMLEYGRLANRYTVLFDRKWVHPTGPQSEAMLGTGDIQSLADLGNSYAIADSMRIAPISKRLVVQLAVQAGLPLLPVIIMGTPTPELIHEILKMVA